LTEASKKLKIRRFVESSPGASKKLKIRKCERSEHFRYIYSDADVPVNERQQWFLNQLRAGENIKSTDLGNHWNVAEKTAKRDISYLTKQGIIEFIGPLKTGAYYLEEQRDIT
jgi:predicted HTH transcriptional regulator